MNINDSNQQLWIKDRTLDAYEPEMTKIIDALLSIDLIYSMHSKVSAKNFANGLNAMSFSPKGKQLIID
jgi:hypothetical protein